MNADEIMTRYQLKPHPEGGYFREIFRDPDSPQRRGSVTSIYYLLKSGEVSHWHRIDAIEIWHFHSGAPLKLEISADGSPPIAHRLGVTSDSHPQVIIPPNVWQSARSEGDWTLVGCTTAPAFSFSGFEMAPPGWYPGQGTQAV